MGKVEQLRDWRNGKNGPGFWFDSEKPVDNPGMPTDTSRYKVLFEKMWKDHGIYAIHIQDRELPDFLREYIRADAKLRYGRRL